MDQKKGPVIAAVVAAVAIVGFLGYYFLGGGGSRGSGDNPYDGNAPYAPGKGLPAYGPGGKSGMNMGPGSMKGGYGKMPMPPSRPGR